MRHFTTKRRLFTFIATMAAVLAGAVPQAAGRIRCCLSGTQCKRVSPKRCTRLGGTNLGPGTCAPDTCAPPPTTTTTTLPPCGDCCTSTLLQFTTGTPSSTVTGTVKDDSGAVLLNLTAGGLYFGGAGVGVPLPSIIPDKGTSFTKLTTCDSTAGTFSLAATGTADVAGKPGVPAGNENRFCTSAGVINPEYPGLTGCLFGAPLPIPNPNGAATSTCVVNRVTTDASGSGTCSTGTSNINIPLGSDIYLTGPTDGLIPCPRCVANPGPGTTCQAGPNAGQPCTPGNSASLGAAYPTSHDCPPASPAFVGTLPIPFNLTTGTQTKTSADLSAQPFVFCGFCGQQFSPSFQGPPAVPCTADAQCTNASFPKCRQRNSGAFGQGPARTITENGSPAGVCIADGAPHDSTLVSVFCIPPAFNATVDPVGDLPGPGAVALPGQAQLM